MPNCKLHFARFSVSTSPRREEIYKRVGIRNSSICQVSLKSDINPYAHDDEALNDIRFSKAERAKAKYEWEWREMRLGL
jgi:predicted house-cleaning NTP pyrophosphatase (Maf/HAM1 superfamily)